MTVLESPTNILSSFLEKAKFNFVWRINVVFMIVGFIMTIVTYISDNKFFIYYLIVFFTTIISLLFLKHFKTYRQVATVLFLAITVVLGLAIFTVPESLHLQEAVYMVVLILSVFFTLGNKWGFFYLAVNSAFYLIYYNFLFAGTAYLTLTIRQEQLFILSIEFLTSMFLIGFVMYQFSLVLRQAVKSNTEAFDELKKGKQIEEHQNKEKTVLLQEIHHRVKNNLQVIVSLLRMQSRDIDSEETRKSFEEAINRVLTMSLIHQKMYEKESLVDIDIKDYLNTLIQNLIDSSSLDKKVDFKIDSTLKSVSAKSIVPLGLIINELVSNSIKHAFKESGRIELTLKPRERLGFSMIYFDNGKWKENNGKTFGTQLIETFTEQLEGTYERTISDSGTTYHFNLTEELQD